MAWKASYQKGVEWIAGNDEPDDLNPENVAGYISTSLLADLFQMDTAKVGQDIVTERLKRLPQIKFYEYMPSNMFVCMECLDRDLAATRAGDLVGDERVYPGMYRRLYDDLTEPYQCDSCGTQNAAYEMYGETP